MNREIKFRGVNNFGEWIYGSLVMTENIRPAIYFEAGNGTVKEVDWQYVKEESIGQFTGLFDKNGKEIYDGDIVKWGHAREWSRENPIRIAEVKINPDIQFHSQVGVFKFGNFAYADSIDKDLEVIGNIFENIELLTN